MIFYGIWKVFCSLCLTDQQIFNGWECSTYFNAKIIYWLQCLKTLLLKGPQQLEKQHGSYNWSSLLSKNRQKSYHGKDKFFKYTKYSKKRNSCSQLQRSRRLMLHISAAASRGNSESTESPRLRNEGSEAALECWTPVDGVTTPHITPLHGDTSKGSTF